MHIIRIGLKEKYECVDNPTDTENAAREEIENSHANAAFIEFMCTNATKEEAEEESYPLILGTDAQHCSIQIVVIVYIGVSVGIVDDYIGLFGLFIILNLTTAMGTDYCGLRYLCTAMLAELGGGVVFHIFPSIHVMKSDVIGTKLLVIIHDRFLYVNVK